MTGLVESAKALPSATPAASGHVRRLAAGLPWALPAGALIAALHLTGTPGRAIAAYGVYLVLAVALPGILVHRALRGSRGNLPEDVGYGAATGLLLQLTAWAAATATGRQPLLRWWPVIVVATFIAVPALRRHWRIDTPRRLPLRWSWAVALVLVAVVAWGAAGWSTTPLPPADTVYYQDLLYHLALVHEMTRSMPFEVPQLAGDTLHYHYLSDADMAAASMITGISPVTVLLRLWTVPIAAIAVLVVAALTRDLTGRWWAGPLAAGAAFVGLPLTLGAPVSANGGLPLSPVSPSQTYAMPLLGLLVALSVDAVRGRPLRAAWLIVPPLALACAGAKSSALPPFAVGLVLAGVVAARRRRGVPWPVLALLTVAVAAMAAGFRLFAGGGAGTLAMQPLSVLRWMKPYTETLGGADGVDRGGLLPAGVAAATTTERWFVAWLVGWWLLMQLPRLIGLAALGDRRTRSDPAAWLLGGMIVAGVGAAWLLWHPSASQLYFLLCAAPFGAVLSVWLLPAHARWRPVLLGLGAGALWAVLAPAVPEPVHDTVPGWASALAVPILRAAAVAAVVAAVAVLVLRLAPRVRPAGREPSQRAVPLAGRGSARHAVLLALTAAVLGAGLGTGVESVTSRLWRAVFSPAPGPASSPRLLTSEEMRAALWLDAHAGREDVVATNVHCVPVDRYEPCDARAFWVAGLGGRRTVMESWGYSDATVAANGRDGLRYPLQPPPYPERYALNQRVFTDADPAALAELRRAYGVRWLLADLRAGPVSPRLAALATVRYTAGPAVVYELP